MRKFIEDFAGIKVINLEFFVYRVSVAKLFNINLQRLELLLQFETQPRKEDKLETVCLLIEYPIFQINAIYKKYQQDNDNKDVNANISASGFSKINK